MVASVGLVLQVIGGALILIGTLKAAHDLEAIEEWRWMRWLGARWRSVVRLWRRYVLRRPVVIDTRAGHARMRAGATSVAVGEAPWGGMAQDERVEFLRQRLEALRGRVDDEVSRLDGRVDDVEARASEFKAEVDERFGLHDTRLKGILRYELAGGALVLIGTGLVFLGG